MTLSPRPCQPPRLSQTSARIGDQHKRIPYVNALENRCQSARRLFRLSWREESLHPLGRSSRARSESIVHLLVLFILVRLPPVPTARVSIRPADAERT